MKRAQILGITVALGAGAAAFFGMKSFMKPPAPVIVEKQTVESTQVLVAQADIGLGKAASAANFRWQEWPADAVNPTFITEKLRPQAIRELSGSIARSPIIAGEPITEAKLISAGKGGVLAAILPQGMRAISTRITKHTAVGNMILPNDRVDVILTRRKRGRNGAEEHVSDTLFRNVRVLAIGQQIEAKEDQKNAEGDVATLELTAAQAEMLALSNSMGDISLALRSVADLNAEKNATNEGALGRKAETGSSVKTMKYGVQGRAYGVN